MDTTLDHLCTLFSSRAPSWGSGRAHPSDLIQREAKSPRIQVVLPEDLCARLTAMAELESRTVSNMARVLIQQGVQRHEQEVEASAPAPTREERLRSALESQQPRRLRGAPRRLRLHRPG